MSVWQEVGDRVFVRRYDFLDQTIGAILADGGVLIVDSRASPRRADELVADLREITPLPVTDVVDTHMHWDHTFGNARFPGSRIWGHERCALALRGEGNAVRERLRAAYPEIADELAEVVIVPPTHTLNETRTVSWGGRTVELRHLGRGHTDNDIVVLVPDSTGSAGVLFVGDLLESGAPPSSGSAGVLFVGDLLESGAPPSFGDSYPIDWASTAARLVGLAQGAVVPGHGAVGDRSFARSQAEDLAVVAELARDVHAGVIPLLEAIAGGPFPPETMGKALDRALRQLDGDLG